ncbi:UNVERIFIED_CONTAM: hypothetical protein Sangu_2681500, partial [Sesamum angustifolium]
INNCNTRHLAKILIHLAWCLQECVSTSGVASPAISKALNALFLLSVFLKYLIENAKSDNFEELHLSMDESEPMPNNFSKVNRVDIEGNARNGLLVRLPFASLFDTLGMYNKFAEVRDEMKMADGDLQGDSLPEDPSSELHIYTDFLRLVLEILNSVLTFTLPRNPEVLDFFNSRMDAQKMDDEWSVEKVLQVIINNCRSWRGEGMKIYSTYMVFTYVWQLVLSGSDFSFNSSSINLFPVPVEDTDDGVEQEKLQSVGPKENALQV